VLLTIFSLHLLKPRVHMQTMCLLAEECGMATCLQEAWSTIDSTVRSELNIPDSQLVWCGVAIGYADKSKPVNSLRADREAVDTIARFSGFDGLPDTHGHSTSKL